MIRKSTAVKPFLTVLFMVALMVAVSAGVSVGHGGKSHAGEKFTALEALEKGVVLYKRLVKSGKLEKGWEKDLVRVEISHMEKKDGRTFGVSFHRSHGTPETVYIFFAADGSYGGSNFTGE